MQSKKSLPFTIGHSAGSEPVAVIDLGTNTLRLLIGCVQSGRLIRMASEREVTRLGKNLRKSQTLDGDSIELSIRSIIRFKAKCDHYNVKRIIAIGTSALRDAQDSNLFLQAIKEKTGIDVSVISGETEADLTFKGIKGQNTLFGTSPSIIIDVGGGSTELIICNEQCTKASIPVGGISLFELFIKCDPPCSSNLSDIRDYLIPKFAPVLSGVLDSTTSQSYRLIATGGTAATLASIHLSLQSYDGDKVHGMTLSYAAIESIFKRLVAIPWKERCNIPGLEHERADIILSGTLIITVIMELLHAQQLIISDYGLLEGVLLEAGNLS